MTHSLHDLVRGQYRIGHVTKINQCRLVSVTQIGAFAIGYGIRVVVCSGEPGRVAMLFAPLMRRMVQRSVRGDYARLKALLEG